MTKVKIYAYHKLTPVDILDCIEWARENFTYYNGETSPLWNEHVQKEFARLNKQRRLWQECWENTFKCIAYDLELSDTIDTIQLDESDLIFEN